MSSMINLTDQRSYHLYRRETDMRKGFNLLCGIIVNELGRQVMQGDAFIFINKPRTHLKLLVYEQGGKSTHIDPLTPRLSSPLWPFQIDPLWPAQIDPL
jgi:hypothetical protein